MAYSDNQDKQGSEFAAQLAALIACEGLGAPNKDLGVPFTVVPEGYKLNNLESLLEKPARQRGGLTATTPKAFVEMVRHFGDVSNLLASNIVTVDRDNGVFVAILNADSWGDFRITFSLRRSIQWRAWSDMLGKALSQLAIAEFLEEHTADITAPEGAKVLEIVKNLEVSTRGKIVSAVNLHNGSHEIAYTQSNEATSGASKSNFKMPDVLQIAVPMFDGAEYRCIDVKLRYRVVEDKITFGLSVPTLEDIKRKEIEKVGDTLKAELANVKFFEGAVPEITAGR